MADVDNEASAAANLASTSAFSVPSPSITSSSSNLNTDSSSDSLSTGATVGVVFGVIILILLILVWAFLCLFGSFKCCGTICKRRRHKKEEKIRQSMLPIGTQKGWYTGGQQEYQTLPQQLEMDAGGYGATPEMMGNTPSDSGINFHRAEMMGDVPLGKYRESSKPPRWRWG